MNEALQEKLVEVLDLGKVGILNAFDAVKAQAPKLFIVEYVANLLGR